jgi:hypothetical protein
MLSATLPVHPRVARTILHCSRGLKGGFRSDSDVDLSLIVDLPRDVNTDVSLPENQAASRAVISYVSLNKLQIQVNFYLPLTSRE